MITDALGDKFQKLNILRRSDRYLLGDVFIQVSERDERIMQQNAIEKSTLRQPLFIRDLSWYHLPFESDV